MVQRILVPLDGSEVAERVLPYLPPLFPAWTAVRLLRVVEPQPVEFVWASDSDEVSPITLPPLQAEAREYLEHVRQQMMPHFSAVQVEVVSGAPIATICDAARSHQAGLIAMTTHGATGLRRLTLGSVAEGVLHQTQVPLLLVRATDEAVPPEPLRRILVPLDGSALAEQALPVAAALARDRRAELVLLRAVDPLTEHEIRAIVRYRERRDELIRRFQAEATEYLTPQQEALEARGQVCRSLVVVDHAGDAILQAAAHEAAQVIVMSTHGRSGIGKLVYGSVADHVLHRTTRPLVLVRATSTS